jgi:hypothetical protein
MLMQILAWMWSVVFSLAIGSYVVFGLSSIAHITILGALFMTLAIFQNASRRAEQIPNR